MGVYWRISVHTYNNHLETKCTFGSWSSVTWTAHVQPITGPPRLGQVPRLTAPVSTSHRSHTELSLWALDLHHNSHLLQPYAVISPHVRVYRPHHITIYTIYMFMLSRAL